MGIYSKQAGEVSGCHMSMDAVGIRLHKKGEKYTAFYYSLSVGARLLKNNVRKGSNRN